MDSESTVKHVGVAALPTEFGPTAVLLDVREDDEWVRGHAAGAQHIPMGAMPAHLDDISRSASLYVICKAGGRSAQVCDYLARNGFEPVNVDGGMLAWADAGRPVVTDNGGPGRI